MTVQELLTRLNSIAKANPKNKELEVKFCTQDGKPLNVSLADLVVDLNNAKSFCGLNTKFLDKENYATYPDDGYLSNDSLIQIGEAFGKSFLTEAACMMLNEINSCKEESEIPDTVHKETEVIFDECLKRIRKIFDESGQGPIGDVMSINAYLSAREYVGLNLKEGVMSIYRQKYETRNKNES